jgi:hypothetical protein
LWRAAKRFGIKIVDEKPEHTYDSGARRTDVAVFTQDDYDVLVVADEQGQFGEYLNTELNVAGNRYQDWLRCRGIEPEQWARCRFKPLQRTGETLDGRTDYAAIWRSEPSARRYPQNPMT